MLRLSSRHLIASIALLGGVCLFYYFDLGQWLTLSSIKANQGLLQSWYQDMPIVALCIAFALFTIYAALPVPGLLLITLLCAAVFGFLPAFLITSFGTAIGGTVAFLASRHLFRDLLKQRDPQQFERMNRGIRDEGAYYLFSIRLVPLFPFFLVNSLMGLTQLKTRDFYIATQTGMLASSAVFVNAGTQLGKINDVGELFTPGLMVSFALMGVVPLVGKKTLDYLRHQRMEESS